MGLNKPAKSKKERKQEALDTLFRTTHYTTTSGLGMKVRATLAALPTEDLEDLVVVFVLARREVTS